MRARFLFLLLLFIPILGRADDNQEADGQGIGAEPLRFRGIFDTELPHLEKKYSLTFIIHPHFRDLVDSDWVRVPLEFRYGLSDTMELDLQLESYLSNVFRGGAGSGLSIVRFGAKKLLPDWFGPRVSEAAGVQVSLPMGSAPDGMTDGVNHYNPYVVIARRLRSVSDLSLFLNTSLDIITPAKAEGMIPAYQPQRDSVTISPGIFWDPVPFHWVFSVAWARTVQGEPIDYFTVRPGGAWDIPRRYTFFSSGQWQVGAAVSATFYQGRHDFRLLGKLKWEFDVKQLFQHAAAAVADGIQSITP